MKHERLIAAAMIGPMLWLGIGWSNHLAAQAAQPRYAIDADGIRWQKTVGAATTTYLVDRNQPFEQVLEERDGAGNVTASYVYLDDLVAAAFAGVGTRFYGYDGQMSTRFLTDTGANVTDSYTFDAWGVTLASAGGTPNNYLFTGEQFDPHLGMQYNRARYLNLSLGRFVSHDPFPGIARDPQQLHRYLYGTVDPVNHLDPSGLFNLVDVFASAAIIATVIGLYLSVLGGILTAKAAIIIGAIIVGLILLFLISVSGEEGAAIEMVQGARPLESKDIQKINAAIDWLRGRSHSSRDWAQLIEQGIQVGRVKKSESQEGARAITLQGTVVVLGEEEINSLTAMELAVYLVAEFEHFGHAPHSSEEQRAQDAFNVWLDSEGIEEPLRSKWKH